MCSQWENRKRELVCLIELEVLKLLVLLIVVVTQVVQ